MKVKTVSGIFLMLLLTSMLTSVFIIQPVRAQWDKAIGSGYALTTDSYGVDVPIGQSVTAWAGTTDMEVVQVDFKWLDPSGNMVVWIRPVFGLYTTPSVPPGVPQEITDWANANPGINVWYAQDTQIPYILGDWGVQAVFHDRDIHIRATSFNVASPTPPADTGWKSPSATGRKYDEFTNPTNAYISDDQYATGTAPSIDLTTLQSYENFDFGIPEGAIINGIETSIEWYRTGVTPVESRIWWWCQSCGGWTSRGLFAPTAERIDTLGNASDLWGKTPVASDFSNENFSVGVYFQTGGQTATYYVDHIQVKVYYTLPVVPDFSISASAASLTLQQGNTGLSTITITSKNGFSQPVNLEASAPYGVGVTLLPTQVTPPPDGSATSTLIVSISAFATSGSYILTVTGTSGTLSHSVGISLQITGLPTQMKPNPAYGKGIWMTYIWKTENGNLDTIIGRLKSAKVKWISIKIGDSDSYWLSEGRSLSEWTRNYGGFSEVVKRFHNNGIRVLGAHFVYGYELWRIPDVSEVDVSNEILDIEGIDGLLINAENDTESGIESYRGYLENLRNEHADSFIAYTSYARSDGYRTDLHELFTQYSDVSMPQAYWAAPRKTDNPEKEIFEMEANLGVLRDKWHGKPIMPMGQGGKVKMGEVYSRDVNPGEILEFSDLLFGKGYLGISLFSYDDDPFQIMPPDWRWEEYRDSFNEDISVTGLCPVDLIVMDPDGLVISKSLNEILGASYMQFYVDENGDPDDVVTILHSKLGNYSIEVTPEPEAIPTDTFTLVVSTKTETAVLADDIAVNEIPSEPYIFQYTATIDFEPDTLNLKSKGQWITAYIQLPEGYSAAEIHATTIMLNGTISPVLDPKYSFVTNSSEYLIDHNNDGILERMIKFDRADLESYIYHTQGIRYGNVALTISGTLNDGTPFKGTDTIFANYAGDANNDGTIDVFDILKIKYHRSGPPSGTGGYDVNADLDQNGFIDVFDILIAKTNLGQTVPKPPA